MNYKKKKNTNRNVHEKYIYMDDLKLYCKIFRKDRI